MQPPLLPFARFGPQPQQWQRARSQRHGDAKAGAARSIFVVDRIDFMQLRACQPLQQPRIDRRRDGLRSPRAGGNAPQSGDQGGRVVHVCSCNVLYIASPSLNRVAVFSGWGLHPSRHAANSAAHPPTSRSDRRQSGRSSGVEHNLAKVGVEGSNPFARSSFQHIAKNAARRSRLSGSSPAEPFDRQRRDIDSRHIPPRKRGDDAGGDGSERQSEMLVTERVEQIVDTA